jgi:hypothetical protein
MQQIQRDIVQNAKQNMGASQKPFGEMNINMSYPRECIKKYTTSNIHFSDTSKVKFDGNDPFHILSIKPMTLEPSPMPQSKEDSAGPSTSGGNIPGKTYILKSEKL